MTGAAVAVGARAEVVSDESLVRDILGGDERAFLTLVSREHPAMVRYAATLLEDETGAEPAVIQAWPAILAGLASFDGRSSLRCWMCRTVTRVARGWKPSTSASSAAEPGVAGELRARLGRLPQLERQVLLLCDVERWNAEEVCTLLGTTDRTRRRLLHAARRTLHEGLQGSRRPIEGP